MTTNAYQSWGRFPKASHEYVSAPQWRGDVVIPQGVAHMLPYGQGRSYGDCCLNAGGALISTRHLDRFIAFDTVSGIVRCEAGVTLAALLDVSVSKGWFVSVTPGTKFVSVGGAIANDVHGKNHHRGGTFGRWVRGFTLLRSNGETMWCSPNSQSDLFHATIGGIGLTGLILDVELQLKPVSNPFIDMQSIKFSNVDEFFEISRDSDKTFDYTVAWIDCVHAGTNFGRGIFMRGNHSTKEARLLPPFRQPRQKLMVPIEAPSFALNPISVSAFNTVYYHKQRAKEVRTTVSYDPFFYPLDAVGNWNRIYGARGFLQFQCVVPSTADQAPIKKILRSIITSGRGSFLAVLKEFGEEQSPAIMSFPRPGVTLCLDFPHEGPRTITLMRELEEFVTAAGGALYPAKDACMQPASFKQYYPRWQEFREYIDPRFSSSFWRRVTQ